jgi:hypothetical protein
MHQHLGSVGCAYRSSPCSTAAVEKAASESCSDPETTAHDAENLAVTFMLLPHYAGCTSPAQLGALGSFLFLSTLPKGAPHPGSAQGLLSSEKRKLRRPRPGTFQT